MSLINEDFILQNEYAKTLFHKYAKDMPIFDFHCHLEAKEIYENKTLTQSPRFGLEEITTNGVL